MSCVHLGHLKDWSCSQIARHTQPKCLGPAGFYDTEWFKTFLEVSGPHVVDGVTHHIYNHGAGVYQFSLYSLDGVIPFNVVDGVTLLTTIIWRGNLCILYKTDQWCLALGSKHVA